MDTWGRNTKIKWDYRAKKTQNEALKGFLSGAWSQDEYEYPTHSVVTLDNKGIKKILGFMDKVTNSKDISSVNCGVGYCDYFRVPIEHFEKVASILGVKTDDLSNVSTDKLIPLFNSTEIPEDLIETYRTGGMGECEVHGDWVFWRGEEKYSNSRMESPCINRATLEKWLEGDFT